LRQCPPGNFRLGEILWAIIKPASKKRRCAGTLTHSARWQHTNLKNSIVPQEARDRTRTKIATGGTMPSPEIPAEMRAFAERSLEQAKLAFDKFMDAAQSTMNTFEGQSKVAQAGAKEVTQKIKDFAEQNVTTTFDHAQKLVQAKDAQTLLTLHREFVQSQMQELNEQVRVLGEISSKAVADTAKLKS
jgi:phasin